MFWSPLFRYLWAPAGAGGAPAPSVTYAWAGSVFVRAYGTTNAPRKIKHGNAVAALELRKSKSDRAARRRGSPARRVMAPAIIEHRQSLYETCKALNAR